MKIIPRFGRLCDTHEAHPGMTVSQSFDIDEKTRDLLIQLRPVFGCDDNAAVIRKALAVASIIRRCVGPNETNVTIKGPLAEYNVNLVD